MNIFFFTTRYIGQGNLFDPENCEQFVSDKLYDFYKLHNLFPKSEENVSQYWNNVTFQFVTNSVRAYFEKNACTNDEMVGAIKQKIPDISLLFGDEGGFDPKFDITEYGDDVWRIYFQTLSDDRKIEFIRGYSELIRDRLSDKVKLSSWLIPNPILLSICENDLITLEKEVYSSSLHVYYFENEGNLFCAIECLKDTVDAKEWCSLLADIAVSEITSRKNITLKSLSLILHDKDIAKKEYHRAFCVAPKEDSDVYVDDCIDMICFYMHTTCVFLSTLLTHKIEKEVDIALEFNQLVSSFFWKDYLVSLLENAPGIITSHDNIKLRSNKPDVEIKFASQRSAQKVFDDTVKSYKTEKDKWADNNISYDIEWLRELPPYLLIDFLRNSIAELK